jgi:hypothetical protein
MSHAALSHADRSQAVSRLVTVAAFAVCTQSDEQPSESKLTLSVRHPVCAWLIAYAQEGAMTPEAFELRHVIAP